MLTNTHFSFFSMLKALHEGTWNNQINSKTFVLTPTDCVRMISDWYCHNIPLQCIAKKVFIIEHISNWKYSLHICNEQIKYSINQFLWWNVNDMQAIKKCPAPWKFKMFYTRNVRENEDKVLCEFFSPFT